MGIKYKEICKNYEQLIQQIEKYNFIELKKKILKNYSLQEKLTSSQKIIPSPPGSSKADGASLMVEIILY